MISTLAGTIKECNFVFYNKVTELPSTVMQIMNFITQNKGKVYGGDVLANIRLMIIELLTNGIKHSETDFITLCVEISESNITLTKVDAGVPFNIQTADNVQIGHAAPDVVKNKTLKVYYDDITTLFANVKDDGSVLFHVVDNDIEDLDLIGDFLEHYGLVILAKSSSSFTYHYDAKRKENYFTCRVDFL